MSINLTSNSLPYNVTIPSNPAYFTHLITQNIPWFFPLILIVAFMWVDYLLSTKADLGGAKTFVISSVVFTFFSYLLIAGGLTTSGMFYLFEIIALASFFFETLITSGFP